jgi:hypothetical protein
MAQIEPLLVHQWWKLHVASRMPGRHRREVAE